MKENRILLFGDRGQVGHQIALQLPEKEKYLGKIFISKTDLNDREAVAANIEKLRPNIIINAAAYTDVEKAEDESTACYNVNAYGPQAIAQSAKKVGAVLIHYSTDYVYADCKRSEPYKGSDPTSEPLNVYGRSKLLGEKLIQESGCAHLILRTSWVFSSRRKNFVKTIINLIATKRDPLKIICDQWGSPTSANEIARQTIAILDRWNGEYSNLVPMSGIYHLACKGFCSWFAFTEEIIRQAKSLGLPVETEQVERIKAKQWASKAKRPHNSRLDCYEFETAFQTEIMGWKEALTEVLKEIVHDERNKLRSLPDHQGAGTFEQKAHGDLRNSVS